MTKKKATKPEGRPSKFKPEYVKQAFKLALLGSTDKQLADFFEVSEATVHNWKIEHPEFLESLKAGKQTADTGVAKSLFKRAMGFKFDELTYEDILDTRVDHMGEVTRVPVTKIKTVRKLIIPDTTAQIFWLKNRRPDMWRDKQEHEHKGKIDIEQITGMRIVPPIPDKK